MKKRLYFNAVLVLIGAIVIGGGFLFAGVKCMNANHKVSIIAPAVSEVKLSKPGRYVIFLEENVMIGNTFYGTTDQIPDMRVKVFNEEETAQVQPAVGQETYTINGTSGYGLLEFEVEKPGTYTVQVEYVNQRDEKIVLAINTKPDSYMLGTTFFAIGGVGMLIGALISIGMIGYGIVRSAKRLPILQNG